MLGGFIFGAVAGAIAVTYWSAQSMPRLRSQLADKVEAAERTVVGFVEKLSTGACARLRSKDAATPEHNVTPSPTGMMNAR